jgi:type I restriction enzyme S subunit
MSFVQVPKEISYGDIIRVGSLSPSSYETIIIENPNKKTIAELIFPPIKGEEVGSDAYVEESPFHFIRTSAIQQYSNLLRLDRKSVVPIKPRAFKPYDLSKGDILYVKDSNIGECCVVHSDKFKQYMVSAGLLKVKPKQYPHYVYAFLKHPIVKKQVELLSPGYSTIRHSKDNILRCKIPFPTGDNSEDVIAYVEQLSKILIQTEVAIQNRNYLIDEIIRQELTGHQEQEPFRYIFPTIADIRRTGRMDAGLYSEYFQRVMFTVTNYSRGHKRMDEMGFDIRRGQNLQFSAIGSHIVSEIPRQGYYTLIYPTYVSDYRTVEKLLYLGSRKQLEALQKGDILFGAEGMDRGRTTILCEIPPRAISNIHAVLINKQDQDMVENIFIGCFLGYLKKLGIMELVGVGSKGGSAGPEYLRSIEIPDFPDDDKESIARLYYNPTLSQAESLGSIQVGLSKPEVEPGIFQLNLLKLAVDKQLNTAILEISQNRPTKMEAHIQTKPFREPSLI